MLVIFAFPSLALAFVSQFRLKVNTDRSQLGRSLQVDLPSVCSLGELLIDYMETGGDWRGPVTIQMWYWEKMSRSVLDKACGGESTRPYDVFVLVVQKYKLE